MGGVNKDAGKTDMYSTYELLPDKKVPKPSSKSKKKKSVESSENSVDMATEKNATEDQLEGMFK